jgi:hypothetical protein
MSLLDLLERSHQWLLLVDLLELAINTSKC